MKKAPVETPQSKIDDTTAKLEKKGFIEEMMKRYESEWKDAKNTKKISQDMFVPQDKLQ